MIIIIDGYNLLKQVFPHGKKHLDPYKTGFIHQLAEYKSLKQADIDEIILVFDAGPLPHATREIRRSIVIIHSGQRHTADDWIINYVHKHKNKNLLIVTKDRAIINACKQVKASTMDVFTFNNLVQERLSQETRKQKKSLDLDQNPSQISSHEYELPDILEGYEEPDEFLFDDLMQKMSSHALDTTKPQDEELYKKGNPHKKSKKERLEELQLKKLK